MRSRGAVWSPSIVLVDVDFLVSCGERVGFWVPTVAKTTLLGLIPGTLAPDSGTVRLGTNVQIAYFDQMREVLDPEKTVCMLSGGERNRLLLARLFAKPANVLVLDEPTNDLDIESLELLEAALQDYAGTILLVSHDRAFLDNVVTQTIAAQGNGTWKEYAGGYNDYLRQRAAAVAPLTRGEASPRLRGDERGVSSAPKARAKLSYKETRELEALPREIEALEAEQRQLTAKMSEPEYYKQRPDKLRADQTRTTDIERLLIEKLERWAALEALQQPR